jgi:hypothetical protein
MLQVARSCSCAVSSGCSASERVEIEIVVWIMYAADKI